ncbi:hypothetical protein [Thermosyntropha sp.]|uniref:hypothetical protein n=1 Tax=Thermosyntropha sp. TaxID=2740820 RepID=UPI0025D8602F|nr:hypothetical protein [Thermosyntropha sp.]MBO8158852.1 hypothetical protein [Thermosyntropha sp.]
MPRNRRKSRKRKNRPDKYRGGTIIVNRSDTSIRDYMSPGKLVAWAEWVPNQVKAKKKVN